jgi:hypothetical protein
VTAEGDNILTRMKKNLTKILFFMCHNTGGFEKGAAVLSALTPFFDASDRNSTL